MNYLLGHGTRETPQNQPILEDQVQNNAGGYVWTLDCWARLRRFLILGSEGGSYYASEKKMTTENVQSVRECIKEDGIRTVSEIVAISHGGAAPKNDPALYALAACISMGNRETRREAAEVLPQVARTGTHLYHFVAFAETMRGWGRTMRWAVANWYRQNPEQLALQAIKYRQRDGWSHRDLLRLAHPVANSEEVSGIYRWIVTGKDSGDPLIEGFERAQASTSPHETARIIRECNNLPREALLTEHLIDPEVWRALLEKGMPVMAMTRNLANMTRAGVIQGAYRSIITDALNNQDLIRKSRLHPMALLIALRTYTVGHGMRGTNTWTPVPDVIDALDAAFYLAFDNVEPTGKNHLLALDVSGSMAAGGIAGSFLTPREASVAMALVTLHAEQNVEVMGFSNRFVPLALSRRQRLDDAIRHVSNLPFERTDCALPMLYALHNRTGAEMFAVYTDNETWAGSIHPKQALDKYRNETGIKAKSAVVGMTSSGFSIADPSDPGMMDLVGFDAAAPAVMAGFARGDF